MLLNTGMFAVYEDGEHCNSPDRLLRGDILITRTKGHTVVVLSDGAAAAQEKNSPAVEEPKKVTKPEAARAFSKSAAGTYKTISALHLRAGAGKNKASLVVLPKGTTVHCYGYYTVTDGTRWLYVQALLYGKEKVGFCSANFLKES